MHLLQKQDTDHIEWRNKYPRELSNMKNQVKPSRGGAKIVDNTSVKQKTGDNPGDEKGSGSGGSVKEKKSAHAVAAAAAAARLVQAGKKNEIPS